MKNEIFQKYFYHIAHETNTHTLTYIGWCVCSTPHMTDLVWLGLALMMITRPEILENYPKGDINAGHDILVFRCHNVRICWLISLRVLLIYEIRRLYLFICTGFSLFWSGKYGLLSTISITEVISFFKRQYFAVFFF